MTIDEAIERLRSEAIEHSYNMQGYSRQNKEQIAEWLEELKELRNKQGWISVNDRLPKDRRTVLVTAYWHETYQVMEASYYGDGLWWCVPFNNCGEHMQKLKPIAWMPLPSSYKRTS